MPKHYPTPRIVHCRSAVEAHNLAFSDKDGEALMKPPGSLDFHRLIAEHGAGVFTTLYVAPALRGKFMCPAGAIIEEIES